MTALDDTNEVIAAVILRFRNGEIGPHTARLELVKLRVDRADIDAMLKEHIDECARNMRNNL